MFFLAFLLLGGVVWILGMALVVTARRRAGVYSALSLSSVSFPHWYLARGALGIAIMLVGLVGIVSPVIAAWLVSRKRSPSVSPA